MVLSSANKGPAEVEKMFSRLDKERQEVLDRARHMAALTKPAILAPIYFDQPNTGHSGKEDLPKRYQSTGSRGINNMVGKMLMALWPPGVQWYKFEPMPALKFQATEIAGTPDAGIAQLENIMFGWSLIIQAHLDTASLDFDRHKRNSRFRTAKRESLEQLLITGDSLQFMDDDFRLRTFNRNMYVTQRDSCKEVLYHAVRECIDPLGLDEKIREKAKLEGLAQEEDPSKRLTEMFTRIMWQPLSEKWKIEQEMNGYIINTSEEPVTPFFSTSFNLMCGEHYGRGFIEDIEGDLNAHNELRERLLDFAAIASKKHPVFDQNSVMSPEDIEQPSGTALIGRVRNGHVEDMAWTGVDKLSDFSVVTNVDDRIAADLHKSMLMESDIQPQKDRVTAEQVQRIAAELEGSLGGLYAPIAESEQEPVLRRTFHVLQKSNVLPTMKNKNMVKGRALTGIEALSREISSSRLLRFVQIISSLPEGQRYLRMPVLINLLQRQNGIYENGLIKSAEEIAQEDQNAMQQQLAMSAGEKAVDTAGNVVENQLKLPGAA
jgi:hypothetical protein